MGIFFWITWYVINQQQIMFWELYDNSNCFESFLTANSRRLVDYLKRWIGTNHHIFFSLILEISTHLHSLFWVGLNMNFCRIYNTFSYFRSITQILTITFLVMSCLFLKLPQDYLLNQKSNKVIKVNLFTSKRIDITIEIAL